MTHQPTQEPPIVLPPLVPAGGATQSPPRRNASRASGPSSLWLLGRLGGETYGAPRVFDLYTLLAITVAFALLVAGLRLLGPLLQTNLEIVAATLGGFVSGIAIFQLALFQGKQPRLASLVGGPILCCLIAAAVWIDDPRQLWSFNWRLVGLLIGFAGLAAGYLGGALVAGVFLIADALRPRARSTASTAADNDVFIFGRPASLQPNSPARQHPR